MQPARTPPTPENQARLAEQVRRRRQFVDMLATEKQRLSGLDDAGTLPSIREHIAFLQGQIGQCNARIRAEIAADATLARKAVLLESIPSIGTTTATILITELPELGIADKKQIAALAGVAPMNRDSGQWRGPADITSGRLGQMRALYSNIARHPLQSNHPRLLSTPPRRGQSPQSRNHRRHAKTPHHRKRHRPAG